MEKDNQCYRVFGWTTERCSNSFYEVGANRKYNIETNFINYIITLWA